MPPPPANGPLLCIGDTALAPTAGPAPLPMTRPPDTVPLPYPPGASMPLARRWYAASKKRGDRSAKLAQRSALSPDREFRRSELHPGRDAKSIANPGQTLSRPSPIPESGSPLATDIPPDLQL